MKNSQTKQQSSASRGDTEAKDNVYHQNFPEETEDHIQDAQVLPIHFNYNFMERDKIPLHNEKYSRQAIDHAK